MARQLLTRLVDDLDESEATGTVRFGYEGGEYEIDLNDEHLLAFEEFLAPYIEHARRIRDGHGRRRRKGSVGEPRTKRDMSAIRQWAREQGYQVSDRGRIAIEIRDRYDETH